MRFLTALAGLLALVMVSLTGPAQAAGLGGSWSGHYYYSDNRAPVPFTMDLMPSGNNFIGTMSEPNTFGNSNARFLEATVQGKVSGQRVNFTKSYAGRGANHSVNYDGRLSNNDMVVKGSWWIGQTRGTFTMQRTR